MAVGRWKGRGREGRGEGEYGDISGTGNEQRQRGMRLGSENYRPFGLVGIQDPQEEVQSGENT